jgi:membrane-associated phospholipid phosphatase
VTLVPPAGAAHGARQPASRTSVRAYLQYAVPVAVLFCVCYFSLNWLTARRSLHYRLYFDWELAIPFVPAMIVVYASIFGLFLLPGVVLPGERLAPLARTLVAVILVAAATFLLLPADLGFQRSTPDSIFRPIFQLLYALDRPHNLVPSLHIACAVPCLAALLDSVTAAPLKWALWVWGGLLSASVLLVHQHHLLDVLSGWLLGIAAYRLVYLRARKR